MARSDKVSMTKIPVADRIHAIGRHLFEAELLATNCSGRWEGRPGDRAAAQRHNGGALDGAVQAACRATMEHLDVGEHVVRQQDAPIA